jgi:hypothetical protein
MKRILPYLLIVLFAFSFYAARPVLAQSETPPATPVGPVGEIRGTVVNRNSGKAVNESTEVMLHILDLDYAEKDMKHAKSQPDGTFIFKDVPFDTNLQFGVMATFQGVTYFSEIAPANMNSLQVALDAPVYETTKDLAGVQVDQMHVVFDFSTDGLETKEIYIVSNSGERTVKDVYELGDGKFAALKFPLPKDADYIFFKPDDQDRFVKQGGSFADTYPVLPGNQPAQVMTSYLVPYSGQRTYTYTAPVDIARINFLLPDQAGVSLKGTGVSGPEPMAFQEGSSYQVYSYTDLKAGETVSVTLAGTPAAIPSTNRNKTKESALAIGVAFLGFAFLGVGIWWWRRPEEDTVIDETEDDGQAGEPTLDDLIAEIAQLDETHETQGLSPEEYQRQRQELMQRAKHLL